MKYLNISLAAIAVGLAGANFQSCLAAQSRDAIAREQTSAIHSLSHEVRALNSNLDEAIRYAGRTSRDVRVLGTVRTSSLDGPVSCRCSCPDE
jgi:hypothetical protein